ncbi:hypothetical protein DH2020_038126 [Rehmannia glutinosa]|uniref:Ataxin-10 domain-containing protein n=1 Tax=Rehmannia glutinosa TaxID=99300 RepID=A0ABR0UZU4_REHGL
MCISSALLLSTNRLCCCREAFHPRVIRRSSRNTPQLNRDRQISHHPHSSAGLILHNMSFDSNKKHQWLIPFSPLPLHRRRLHRFSPRSPAATFTASEKEFCFDDTPHFVSSCCSIGVSSISFESREWWTSTLNKALERLIETAKTSDGRLDLASKHILSPVLQLCQYPLQLSGQDLFLSIKLVRNLCAGEIKNQNLFIEQNGVGILSTLVTSVRLTCSDNRILPMSSSRETGDPLCMVLYTCSEGSDEQLAELFADPGQDIVVEIIQTVTVAGFREDWVKLLLSKICLEEPYFPSIFSKLSRVVETENSDHFSEKAFLLRILSEILNERVGDIVVSTDFSLCIFGILRSAVGIFEFGTREKLPLPTGSADIDVIGYTLSILRDICACDPKFSNQDEKEDVVDKLVSAGLIKFLIGLLRDLEPPAMIRKATINNDAKNEATLQFSKYCPYRGFRRDVVAVIGNCSYRKKHVQDEIREQDGILLLLQQCVTDEDNPFLREWGFWSMRNILEGNAENQQLVTDLELQKSVDTPEIAGLGLRVEVDPKTRRPKLVNV